MKKMIKAYLTKLRENEEKGFSLVELIIVMAIMAILVGIVASQVIPYMEKSRESKDQQQLSSIGTNLVSAIAQDPKWNQKTACSTAKTFKLDDLGSKTTPEIENTFADLCGEKNIADTVSNFKDKMTSDKAKGKDIMVKLTADKVTVSISGQTSGKLIITTE